MSTRVLLLDDDSNFRTIVQLKLRSFLKQPDFVECASLQEVRDYFSTHPDDFFDLVFLDQHLPDGRGIELLEEGVFSEMIVLAVSSDDSYEMPGETLSAGAAYFLPKDQVRSQLFNPLVKGVIERNKLQRAAKLTEVNKRVLELVKTHIGTLQHEINNPLGAVLGAAYLIHNSADATSQQKEAAGLVEKSGKRIKHVLDQICKALEEEQQLEVQTKGKTQVFQVPGDAKWD